MHSSAVVSPATEALERALQLAADHRTVIVEGPYRSMISTRSLKRPLPSTSHKSMVVDDQDFDSFDMSSLARASITLETSIDFPVIEWASDDSEFYSCTPSPCKRECRRLVRCRKIEYNLDQLQKGNEGDAPFQNYSTSDKFSRPPLFKYYNAHSQQHSSTHHRTIMDSQAQTTWYHGLFLLGR